MIAHQDIALKSYSIEIHRLDSFLIEDAPVLVIPEDRLLLIPTTCDVVYGSRIW